MHKKISALLFAVFAAALTTVGGAFPVSAQSITSSDFTVKAIIPDNQIEGQTSYFDLRMTPGQSQTLKVDVINRRDSEMTVDVALHAASTNRNGAIEYQVAVSPDETLKIPFDTISSTAAELQIPAKSTKTAEIIVTMPAGSYDGAVLGGIVFTGRENGEADEGVSIKNKFSYVIGVKLTENDTLISPDFRLKSVEPTLINYRRAVTVGIHNPVALIVKNAGVTAHVYRKGENTPLFSVSKTSLDMAPNSVFPLPVEWDGHKMEAGDYVLKLKLSDQDRVWDWEQAFTITADKANDINSSALDPVIRRWYDWWWLILIGVIVILLLLWLVFLLGRRRGEKEKRHTRAGL